MKSGAVTLNDFRIGDRLFATVRPDPQRALTYGAGTLDDLDLAALNGVTGQITDVSQDGSEVSVKIGTRTLVVDLSKDTLIRLANGKHGSIAALSAGVGVKITGVRNTRLDEVTTAYEIRVVSLGHGRGKPKP
jgi:hypothetical protein